jgi:hypothetical protein
MRLVASEIDHMTPLPPLCHWPLPPLLRRRVSVQTSP